MTPVLRDLTRWPVVEGYCSPQSCFPGETVPVHCTSRGGAFDLTVTRVGGRRDVYRRRSGLEADDGHVPDRAWADGCGWPVTFEVPVGDDWPSGFYEIEFSDRQDHGESGRSHAFFVVRDRDAERENAVLVLSTATYAAYNHWGGGCLYTGEVQVSFDRPMERGYLRRPAAPFETDFDGRAANTAVPSDPTHRRLLDYQARHHYPLWTNSAGWHNWERRFVRWAEAEGWRFGFATSQDLHHDASLLSGRELMITVGHDEYWSWEMRDAVEGFVRAGGNWLVLSGNTAAWQVRFEGNAMVCHKSAVDDPLSGTDQDHLVTTMWADPILGRPETRLHGLTFTRGGYHRIGHAVADGRGGYEVHRPDHWALEALDLERGDLVGSQDFCVGYEVDGCALEFAGDLPFATGEDGAPASIEILATAPARLMSITDSVCEAPAGLWASMDPPGDLEQVSAMLYGANAGAARSLETTYAVMASMSFGRGTVFNGGSADWAYGLDRDEQIRAITRTALGRLGCRRI